MSQCQFSTKSNNNKIAGGPPQYQAVTYGRQTDHYKKQVTNTRAFFSAINNGGMPFLGTLCAIKIESHRTSSRWLERELNSLSNRLLLLFLRYRFDAEKCTKKLVLLKIAKLSLSTMIFAHVLNFCNFKSHSK